MGFQARALLLFNKATLCTGLSALMSYSTKHLSIVVPQSKLLSDGLYFTESTVSWPQSNFNNGFDLSYDQIWTNYPLVAN